MHTALDSVLKEYLETQSCTEIFCMCLILWLSIVLLILNLNVQFTNC